MIIFKICTSKSVSKSQMTSKNFFGVHLGIFSRIEPQQNFKNSQMTSKSSFEGVLKIIFVI